MKKLMCVAVTAALGLVASSAFAQSAYVQDDRWEQERLFADGYLEISQFDDGVTDGTYVMADFDVGVDGSKANGNPFGFSLGVNGTDADLAFPGDEGIALYPTVSFDSGFGEFSAGIPRSAVDSGYLPERVHSQSTVFDLSLSLFTGPALKSLYLSNDSDHAWGARYDMAIGNTSFGVSANRMSDLDADFLAAAFRTEFGNVGGMDSFALFGGYEDVDAGFISGAIYDLGLEGRVGGFNGEVSYRKMTDGFDADVFTTHLDYDITEAFTIGASYLDIDADLVQTDAWGLGAEYRFYKNFFVDASWISHDLLEGETYEVSLGVQF